MQATVWPQSSARRRPSPSWIGWLLQTVAKTCSAATSMQRPSQGSEAWPVGQPPEHSGQRRAHGFSNSLMRFVHSPWPSNPCFFRSSAKRKAPWFFFCFLQKATVGGSGREGVIARNFSANFREIFPHTFLTQQNIFFWQISANFQKNFCKLSAKTPFANDRISELLIDWEIIGGFGSLPRCLLFLAEITFWALFWAKKKIEGKQKMHVWHVFNYTFFLGGGVHYKTGQKWHFWPKCGRQTGLTP